MEVVKEAAQNIVEELPEDATWDDLMYEIYVNKRSPRGRPPPPKVRWSPTRGPQRGRQAMDGITLTETGWTTSRRCTAGSGAIRNCSPTACSRRSSTPSSRWIPSRASGAWSPKSSTNRCASCSSAPSASSTRREPRGSGARRAARWAPSERREPRRWKCTDPPASGASRRLVGSRRPRRPEHPPCRHAAPGAARCRGPGLAVSLSPPPGVRLRRPGRRRSTPPRTSPCRHLGAGRRAGHVDFPTSGSTAAPHYLIHSYDDPVHAPLGLRAAASTPRLPGRLARTALISTSTSPSAAGRTR